MANEKHTGGDWHVERGGELMPEGERLIISSLGPAEHNPQINAIRTIARTFGGAGVEESVANAYLLAASKDLLAALKEIRHMWAGHAEECRYITSNYKSKCDCDWPKIAERCDAAISKSTGAA